jgi:hypothetical protein
MYVGYSHLTKGTQEMPGGRQLKWLAERLRAKTGIDPLCIDQTAIIEPREGTRDRALADSVFARRDDDSVVLRKSEDPHRFWPATPAWDMQVIHRPTRLEHGRPHWMSMRGYRKPRAVPARLMPKAGQRLIQAFAKDEATNAVPIDQFIVTAGDANAPMLMLPEGRFRFATQD